MSDPKYALPWLILRYGIFLASIGTAIGLALSFAVMYSLSKAIPDIPGNGQLVVAGTAATLVAVSLVASRLPARKATRVDPLAALRTE